MSIVTLEVRSLDQSLAEFADAWKTGRTSGIHVDFTVMAGVA